MCCILESKCQRHLYLKKTFSTNPMNVMFVGYPGEGGGDHRR